MKVYLAGPMTGYPQFNIPAFDAAAAVLRERGLLVVNPAELDSPEVRAAALASRTGDPADLVNTGETWGDMLARDVKAIADDGIEAIYVLPGWGKSRGARLETFVGRALCGLPIINYSNGLSVTSTDLAKAWLGYLFERVLWTGSMAR